MHHVGRPNRRTVSMQLPVQPAPAQRSVRSRLYQRTKFRASIAPIARRHLPARTFQPLELRSLLLFTFHRKARRAARDDAEAHAKRISNPLSLTFQAPYTAPAGRSRRFRQARSTSASCPFSPHQNEYSRSFSLKISIFIFISDRFVIGHLNQVFQLPSLQNYPACDKKKR